MIVNGVESAARGSGGPGEEFGEPDEAVAALDLLLSDAALGAARRFRPNTSMARFAVALARRPRLLAAEATALATEFGKIVAGTSTLVADRGDRRFADVAWRENPLLRRTVQAYLAAAATAGSLLDGAELGWRDRERMRFLLANTLAAAAPSNNPLLSPVAWKAAIDTGGLSAVRGLRAMAADARSAPRVPSTVDSQAFEVGRDLAVTPGAVVARTEVAELLQYETPTASVHRYPLLIVPPMINKFYITDLAPGRSMVEYLLSQGHQVFVISWRNPDARHADWGIDAYGGAIVDAFDAVRAITRAAKASICALCAGGILAAMVVSALHDAGRRDRLASLCLGVTALDHSRADAGAGAVAALTDRRTAAAAVAASRARGYLDGRALAEVFAWLRPDDLIWNYWVNNYLQGRKPPAFDILYWNADTTRMPAALHRDFVDLALGNALATPGGATLLGSPVDLAKVDGDAYVVAGVADHLVPWQACYRSAALLGGDVRFVLSSGGHIACMVNPPTNPKTTFRAGGVDRIGGVDPGRWLAGATKVAGSWWPDYATWLADRAGGRRERRTRLGSAKFPPLGAAPGSYVLDR